MGADGVNSALDAIRGELAGGMLVRDQTAGTMTLEKHAALIRQHVAAALRAQPLTATVDEQQAYSRMQCQEALNGLSTGSVTSRSW